MTKVVHLNEEFILIDCAMQLQSRSQGICSDLPLDECLLLVTGKSTFVGLRVLDHLLDGVHLFRFLCNIEMIIFQIKSRRSPMDKASTF